MTLSKKVIKLYSISLQGQGDHELALVSKDVFAYIIQPRPKFPRGVYSVIETDTVPVSVAKKLAVIYPEEFGESYTGVEVTTGSCENDRAMVCVTLGEMFGRKRAHFWSMKDQSAFCKKHSISIVDYYEGQIY